MSDYLISEETMTNLADSVRTLSGETGEMTPNEIINTVNNTKSIVDSLNEHIDDKNNPHNVKVSQITDFPTSLPASDVSAWAKASSKPTYTATEVGAVPTTRTVNGKALSSNISLTANDVGTDSSGSANTVQTNLNTHTSNKNNPHGVTLAQLGVNATAAELNYVDGVTSAIQTQLNGKAPSSHNHAASNITSGTLPVVRGGTGVTSLDALKTSLGISASMADMSKHTWRRRLRSRVFTESSGTNIYQKDVGVTIYYADSVITDYYGYQLVNPKEYVVTSYDSTLPSLLVGKYMAMYTNTNMNMYIKVTSVSGMKNYARISGTYYSIASTTTGGLACSETISDWEYLYSDTNSTYPTDGLVKISGTSNVYEYWYLGIPNNRTTAALNALIGTYTGTGTNGVDNPNIIPCPCRPILIIIENTNNLRTENGYLQGYMTMIATFPSETYALVRQFNANGVDVSGGACYLKYSDGAISYYSDHSVARQMNYLDYEYRYTILY